VLAITLELVADDVARGSVMMWVQLLEAVSYKIWEGKNV